MSCGVGSIQITLIKKEKDKDGKESEKTIEIPFSLVYNISIRNSLSRIVTSIGLTFNDETDIKNNFPIKDGEELKVIMSDGYGNSIDKTFIVIANKNLSEANKENQTIKLFGISKDAYQLLYTKGYNSYNQMLVSDIVKKELDTLKIEKYVIEETKEKIDIINSADTKFKFIDSLTNRAINKKDKAGYLFYEDLVSIKFKSLSTLIDNNKAIINDYVFDDINKNYKYNIIDWQEIKRNNFAKDGIDGLVTQDYLHYDPDKKEMVKTEVKLDDVENLPKLDKGKIYDKDTIDNADKKVKVVPFYGAEVNKKTLVNDILFKSFSRKMMLLCNGNFGTKVGDIVNIVLPNKINQVDLNKELAGKWLITKILYSFHAEDFKMVLEVSKNSVYDSENTYSKDVVTTEDKKTS